MNTVELLFYLILMAGVTYLIRAIPIVFIRKKVKNRFFRSFLHYIPYAVLTAMTYPAILRSTGSAASALFGLAAASASAWCGLGLMPTAVIACFSVFIAELFIK